MSPTTTSPNTPATQPNYEKYDMEFCKLNTIPKSFTDFIIAKAKRLLSSIAGKKMKEVLPDVCTKLNEFVKVFNLDKKIVCSIKNKKE